MGDNKTIFKHEKKEECRAWLCLVSPSGVVQVQKESFLTKFGKNFIVMSVHVTCESRNVHKGDSSSKTGGVCLMIKGDILLMRKSKIDMSMMLRSLFPELYGYICFTVSQKKGFTSHLRQKWEVVAVLCLHMCDYCLKKSLQYLKLPLASVAVGAWM